MALTIEDGTGIASANSYATVQQLLDYADEKGVTLNVNVAEAEVLLLKAMDWISANFGSKFQGTRVSSDQELHFPRYGVYVDGSQLVSSTIPRQLFYGQLSAALEANANDLQTNPGPAIKRERVEGAVEVEYTNAGKVLPVSAFAKPEALIRPLCRASGLFSVRS